MRKRRLTDEEILRVLREPESGDSVAEICRQHGISHSTFDAWRNRCLQELPEFAELQQLRTRECKVEEPGGQTKRGSSDIEGHSRKKTIGPRSRGQPIHKIERQCE